MEYEQGDLILESKNRIFPKIIEVQYSEEPPIYTLEGLDTYTEEQLHEYYLIPTANKK